MLKLIFGISYLVAIVAGESSIKNLAAYSTDTLSQAPVCSGPNEFIKCNQYSTRYRTYDGTCNNILYPWWGAAQTPYNRLIKPPVTCNGTEPRSHTLPDFNGLPSVMKVSHTLERTDYENAYFTSFFAFFSVFVSHDLFSTLPEYVDCECGVDNSECLNIRLSPYYKGVYYRECIEYVRNLDSRKAFDCMFDHREQISNVSHWLDLSNLYGSNYLQAKNIRAYKDGLLKNDFIDPYDVEIFPILDINKCIKEDYRSLGCFYGPDNRAFQFSSVAAIYTLWLREHNRIAEGLKDENGHWSDETLFQEARRITIALYQNIVYNEFLPKVIGEELMKAFKLAPLKNGHGYFYNDYLYPNIYNEFATAAFPLFNYLPQTVADLYYDINLIDTLWRQDMTYENLLKLISALFTDNSNKGGFTIATTLLTEYRQSPVDGLNDIIALMLQQGRDNTLQAYIEYRTLVGLGATITWDALLNSNIASSVIDRLKEVFIDVDEIDLLIGMLAENNIDKAMVGRTQGFIIAKQFQLLKFGDRLFYENGENYSDRFTEAQLNSIRQYTVNRWACHNGALTTEASDLLYCSNYDKYPDIDITLWKEIPSNQRYSQYYY